jgi:hypothetical protein
VELRLRHRVLERANRTQIYKTPSAWVDSVGVN